MTALVGAIIGHDYGVRDSRGARLVSLSITSDGFVLSGQAFIGDVRDLEANMEVFSRDLSPTDAKQLADLYDRNVKDWRKI